MISVIITAYKEEKTIGKAITSILQNNFQEKKEIIVIAPDDATLSIAKKYSKQGVRILKDEGKGKPSAMNYAVSVARGDILVLTDGDVWVESNSVEQILTRFKDKKIGAVSGKPVSINSRNTRYGFWAFLLTEIAHKRRERALKNKKRFFCSGYLFAIRKKLFPQLSAELLSEDGFISHKVYERGYLIDYSPGSKVYVKYPTNIQDWILQKRRSAGGYNQIRELLGVDMRSFKKESLGAVEFFKHATSLKEVFWLVELFFSRAYLWWMIYKDINLKRKSSKEIWGRVESTK